MYQPNLDMEDVWLPLDNQQTVTSTVGVDDVTSAAISPFDLEWNGTTTFTPIQPPIFDQPYGLGVIVGASGSGKSTLLQNFGTPHKHVWNPGQSIASHFSNAADAATRLYAVGLNSIPTWTKPHNVLSTGERFRVELARSLGDNAVVDEFTSVVDRNVAMSASRSLRRWIDQTGTTGMVLATCHRDVLPWLQPDWIIDTDLRSWVLRPRECLQRTHAVVEVREAHPSCWELFHPHHYLSAKLNQVADCYLATINDTICAFSSVLPFPNGNLRNAFREHRTVVLPDFQGLGVGIRLSDWVAEHNVKRGRRYFSRTAHPRMGGYRDQSPLWRPTGNSQRRQTTSRKYNIEGWTHDTKRVAWSHEYVGDETHVGIVRDDLVETQQSLFDMVTAANKNNQRIVQTWKESPTTWDDIVVPF